MTYQSNPQRSGFRELSPHELDAVSGGFAGAFPAGAAGAAFVGIPGFTVTGSRGSGGNPFADSNSGNGAGGLGSGLSSFQMMDLSAISGLGAVDWESIWDDIKDLVNSDEIVVQGPDEDGDGSPGITVTPPPIKTIWIEGNPIYIRMIEGPTALAGEYVAYDREVIAQWAMWERAVYTPVESGKYQKISSTGNIGISLPPSIDFSFGDSSTIFTPHTEQP